MKLNPLKCAFRVSVGWFLGLMVTQRGIEANPAQLKAILDSPALSSRKRVQQLTDLLATLGRFISRFINRLKPFFASLRGVNQGGLNKECDQALVAIKRYLHSTFSCKIWVFFFLNTSHPFLFYSRTLTSPS